MTHIIWVDRLIGSMSIFQVICVNDGKDKTLFKWVIIGHEGVYYLTLVYLYAV